jgi:hypothetical protein
LAWPYIVHIPRPRRTSAQDEVAPTNAGASVVAATATPPPLARAVGTSQYADTARQSSPARVPAATTPRSVVPPVVQRKRAWAGSASRNITGTTPAFIPPIAKKARAVPAAGRHPPERSPRSHVTSSQGRKAYGSSTGRVAAPTTAYGLMTYSVAAVAGATSPAASSVRRRHRRTTPAAPTSSRASRSSRAASHAGAPSDRIAATTATTGANPVW